MTICFKGNSCKYEIEAVMKLFLPLVTFDFLFEETVDTGDLCIVSSDEKEDGIHLSVEVSYGEKHLKKDLLIKADDPDGAELNLCRLLYRIMQEITGITPEWGLLTGIRPVKKVNALLDEGCSKEEIFSRLKNKYELSDGKLELSYLTAVTQKKYFDSLDRRSFSLYVSVPFCPSRCSYCSFVSHSIESAGAKKLLPDYVEKLCAEIGQTAEIAADLNLKLDTIYIGGGTPTSLSAEQLEKVMNSLKKSFDISKIREYTVEAGRSDTITEEKLRVIKEYGATRISVNPQTMNDSVLKAIGRRHSAEDVVNSFKLARNLGFDNINMDTIAGLPTDTYDGFKNTIDTLCGLDPESITIHTLTVKRSSSLFMQENIDIDSRISDMVRCGQKTLGEHGYLPYYLYRQKNTVDNLENVGYAKPGSECMYNIDMMEETVSIMAHGAGAMTKRIFDGECRVERIPNPKDIATYIAKVDAVAEEKRSLYSK